MKEANAEGETMGHDQEPTLQIAIEIGAEIPMTPITNWEQAGYPDIFSWGDVFERTVEQQITYQA
jgi:hypothetical protein